MNDCGYTVVRFYQRGGKRAIRRGLTLEQAQAHCDDPETCSSTCTRARGIARTRRVGPWFDGYREDRRVR